MLPFLIAVAKQGSQKDRPTERNGYETGLRAN